MGQEEGANRTSETSSMSVMTDLKIGGVNLEIEEVDVEKGGLKSEGLKKGIEAREEASHKGGEQDEVTGG